MSNGKQSGIQPVGKNLPEEPKKSGEFVEMQELVPVMSTFQEHLAAEQSKHQSRLRLLFTLFAVLFIGFLIVPVYIGKLFLEQNRQAIADAKAAQETFSDSISSAMQSLTSASRELREELARQRELQPTAKQADVAAAAEPAPVVQKAVTTPEPVQVVTPPAPPKPAPVAQADAPKPPPEPIQPVMKSAVPTPTPPPAPEVVKVAPPATAATNAPVVAAPTVQAPKAPPAETSAPGPEVAPAATGASDLETLLKQVEQQISEKERELKSRRR